MLDLGNADGLGRDVINLDPANHGRLDLHLHQLPQSWQRGEESYSFDVTTPTLLQYDASCTLTRQRIKAGELDFTGVFRRTHGVLKLTWTACGTPPTKTFEETPAS